MSLWPGGPMPKGKFVRAKFYNKSEHNSFVPKKLVKPPLGFCQFCWKPCDKAKDVCAACYGERV